MVTFDELLLRLQRELIEILRYFEEESMTGDEARYWEGQLTAYEKVISWLEGRG